MAAKGRKKERSGCPALTVRITAGNFLYTLVSEKDPS